MRLRIAVVGAGAEPGSRARQYIATVVKLSRHYELVAVCDAHEPTANAIAGQYGVAPHTDVRKMLERARPDIVLCLTPTDSQPVVALTVIEHGCHLITEIPMGITLSVGDAIAARAGEEGVVWTVSEQVWLWPRERLKRRAIEAGLLGDLTHARMRYWTGAYHGFNAVRMLLDAEARRVRGHVQETPTPPYTAYAGDAMRSRIWEHALIEFDGDIVCVFDKPLDPGNHWTVYGSEGRLDGDDLVLGDGDGETRHETRERTVERDGETLLASVSFRGLEGVEWENPYLEFGIGAADDIAKAGILVGAHRAVTEGLPSVYGADQARRDLELWFATWASSERGGEWVDLPLPAGSTDLEARILEEYRRRYGHDPVEEPDKLLSTRFGRKTAWWTVAQWL
jgi:predicted dehydrogenase